MTNTDDRERASPPESDQGTARPSVLGQLLTTPTVLLTLPSTPRIAEFVARVVSHVPGVGGCRVCLAGGAAQTGTFPSERCERCPAPTGACTGKPGFQCPLGDLDDVYVLPHDTPEARYGFTVCALSSRRVFAPYAPFLANFANFVALALENHHHRDRLEESVAARTADLQHVNEELAREVAARTLAAETLRKLSHAVEQSPASIVITDVEGKIEYVNPKLLDVTGYAPEEVLGSTPRIFKSGETSPEQYARMWQTLRAGGEWRGELRNRKKNGELYWALTSISPIFDTAGKITHFIGVAEDVTEQKRLEQELRQAQKMEAFGQLAGGVAHDFNNLLTVIQACASAVKYRAELSPAQKNALDGIEDAVDRAASLTRQLLTFSRRQAVRLGPLDLNEVVANTTKMLQRVIGEHITLTARFAPSGAPVHADAGMMEQVLMNLAVNSRDAMPKGGDLLVVTELVTFDGAAPAHARPGTFVRLTVADTGIGIAEADLPRIFEPFYTTKELGRGTGLGLATVFGIVQQHKGWIDVESKVGRGTTFHVHLPRMEIAVREASIATRFPAPRGTETILMVEDEATIRTLGRRVLELHGYHVFEAARAIEALEVWNRHRDEIHLLFTDIVMPGGMNGRELADRLQSEKRELRVLFTTGYTDDLVGDASGLRGGSNFLDKPYDPPRMLAQIRACLDACADGEPSKEGVRLQ
jgi:PAS domain S-box-containing protein